MMPRHQIPCTWTMPSVRPTNITSAINNSSASSFGVENYEQLDALLYIIVVLAIYSFGVVVMLIKYVKRERSDMEEETMLQNFLMNLARTSVPNPVSRGRVSNRLALDALNTANIVSQSMSETHKVTFV